MPLCLFSLKFRSYLVNNKSCYTIQHLFSLEYSILFSWVSDLSVTSGILDLTLARLILYYQTCFSSWNRRNYPVWDPCSFYFPQAPTVPIFTFVYCAHASFKLILYSNLQSKYSHLNSAGSFLLQIWCQQVCNMEAFSKMYKSLSWGKYPKAHKKRISSARENTLLSRGKIPHFYLSTRLCKWHNHIYTRRHTHIHIFLFPAYG